MPQMTQTIGTGADDAAVRSELYRLLASSFRFPTVEFFDAVSSRAYYEMLCTMMIPLPSAPCSALVQPLEPQLGGFGAGFDEFCTEYIRLFDVGSGRGKPPCTLYGGEYFARPRLDVMEELIRFYGFFDLAPSDRDRELPDHLSVELEFLHYLAFREGRALEAGADPSSFRRAQADFIERHPGQWLSAMLARLEAQAPLPFFAGLVALTVEILRADLRYLRSMLADA